jgi:hypothetical protein
MPITPTSTPRERFMADGKNVSGHQAIVDGAYFSRAADAVMLEYSRKLANEVDGSTAAIAGLKLKGAQEFLDLFKSFSEQPKPPAPMKRSDNLTPTDQRR